MGVLCTGNSCENVAFQPTKGRGCKPLFSPSSSGYNVRARGYQGRDTHRALARAPLPQPSSETAAEGALERGVRGLHQRPSRERRQSHPSNPREERLGLDRSLVWHSAGSRGNGFLQVLAHELPGTRHLDVVITGVTDEDGVVQLLIGDGQLQVAATGTKHVPTVPVKERENQ